MQQLIVELTNLFTQFHVQPLEEAIQPPRNQVTTNQKRQEVPRNEATTNKKRPSYSHPQQFSIGTTYQATC